MTNNGVLTLMVMYPTNASSEPSMKTNVESLVFSIITFSATFPAAAKLTEHAMRLSHSHTHKTMDTITTIGRHLPAPIIVIGDSI